MNGDHIDQRTIELSFSKRAALFTFVIFPLSIVAVAVGVVVATIGTITDELGWYDAF